MATQDMDQFIGAVEEQGVDRTPPPLVRTEKDGTRVYQVGPEVASEMGVSPDPTKNTPFWLADLLVQGEMGGMIQGTVDTETGEVKVK